MKLTARQPQTKTLADLYRAIDRQHAVTITYLKPGETDPTVRTIEISELRTTAVKISKTGEVRGGDIKVIAMCRLRGEAREFHLSGILAYTVHRIGYILTRPANTTYEATPTAPADDEMALIHFELERDPDDADYRPRVKLTQTSTDLAA
jgi:predicted DNA-binding transcriptional regulator YafY